MPVVNPILLAAKVNDEPGKGQTPRDLTLIGDRFMKGLGTPLRRA